jgi:mycofactocin glycosyltransferase
MQEIATEIYYRLRQEIKLQTGKDGEGFVISQIPLKVLKVNLILMKILATLQSPATLEDLLKQYPSLDKQKLKQLLCSLVDKGYLESNEVCTGFYPSVSIIIPVKNRSQDLRDCLKSLQTLEYPLEKLETIVVDDGSTDDTRKIIESFPVRGIYFDKTRGASACRNKGALEAKGDLLAFIDSDCMADPTWLKELVQYFCDDKVGIVGGYVASYYYKTQVDRYESVSSSLNMGGRLIKGLNNASTAYVPTCNNIVRKKAFISVDGFAEELTVGEDVDLCWRLRKHDWSLLYVPQGIVHHKHRSSLFKMLKRRYQYGTSEGILHFRHRDKRKNIIFGWLPCTFFVLMALSLVLLSWIPLIVAIGFLVIEILLKKHELNKIGLKLKTRIIAEKVCRLYLSCSYYMSFHLVRYYLILLAGLGFIFHGIWILSVGLLLVSGGVDYYVKKPKINIFTFLAIYTLEHLFYQVGVFTGCLKQNYFGSYRVSLNWI